MHRLFFVCAVGSLWIADRASSENVPPPVSDVTIIVSDPEGQLVSDAQVGSILYNSDPENASRELQLILLGERRGPAVPTDERGEAQVSSELLFWNGDERIRPIIAMTPGMARMGIAFSHPSRIGEPVAIRVEDTCRVIVRPFCPKLTGLGRTLDWSAVSVYQNDQGLIEHISRAQTPSIVENVVRLPPGEYRFFVSGVDAYSVRQQVTIESGQREAVLEIELQPTRIVELIGQPAPELQEIKAWRGGEPVTLAEFKGKVVLLDFWGWWCGPCIGGMPKLFELHDRFHDRGLIIIAVHDDSVADVAELESHLAEIRDVNWDGRDIPFRVAIDGGGTRDVPGRHHPVQGATTAAYGVPGWPTYVLIDREGHVRRGIEPHKPEHVQLIEDLLAGDEAAASSP